ncbi:hypothetical protein QLR68_34580, partial [Micromonospora sp. DH15]|nr:hypothetical protein [Micromonospora sp. DH15]
MRSSVKPAAAGLVAALVATLAVALPASPAAAGEPFQSPDTGLVFYSSYPTEIVGRPPLTASVVRSRPTRPGCSPG